jgi:hypothetical protein
VGAPRSSRVPDVDGSATSDDAEGGGQHRFPWDGVQHLVTVLRLPQFRQ